MSQDEIISNTVLSPVQECLELFKRKTNELYTPQINLTDIEKIGQDIEDCVNILKNAVSKLSEEEQKQLQSCIQKEVMIQLVNNPNSHMKTMFFASLAMKLLP